MQIQILLISDYTYTSYKIKMIRGGGDGLGLIRKYIII